jgi:hypothetical protein
MWPSVRATLGSRSGPMTISATTPMTTISEKPMSNIYGVFSFFTSPSIV